MIAPTPSSLGTVLPLLTGAGCFSVDPFESLGNSSLQCHRRPAYSWSPYQLPAADNVHPPPTDAQHSPRGAVILSGVSRGSAFPAVCAGAKRSRRTSLRSPSNSPLLRQKG